MASGLIRMLGLKMSRKGSCNKCGISRDSGNHKKCDTWPTSYGGSKGFHYVSNAKESSLADLKDIVNVICSGEPDDMPVRFELKIMQTMNYDERPKKELTDEPIDPDIAIGA